MKVPTWAKVVAILMLLKGGCGIMTNVNNINAPKMLEMQGEFMEDLGEEIEEKKAEEDAKAENEEEVEETGTDEGATEEETETEAKASDDTQVEINIDGDEPTVNVDVSGGEDFDSFKDILKVSDYYKKWIVIFGYIGIVVSFISILGGIFLFTPKSFSLPLAYGAIGLSIIAAVANYVVLNNDDGSGMISMFSGMGAIMVAVFNVILLLIIVANDKSVYYPMEEDEY